MRRERCPALPGSTVRWFKLGSFVVGDPAFPFCTGCSLTPPLSVTEAARYLRRLMPIMPSTTVKTAQSAMTVCGSIGGTFFRGCPGWRSTFGNSSRMPSLRGGTILLRQRTETRDDALHEEHCTAPRRSFAPWPRSSRRFSSVPLYCNSAPGWRNGRRVGLKNRYRKVCGFESHPGHHSFLEIPNNRTERTRSPSHGGVRAWNECFT